MTGFGVSGGAQKPPPRILGAAMDPAVPAESDAVRLGPAGDSIAEGRGYEGDAGGEPSLGRPALRLIGRTDDPSLPGGPPTSIPLLVQAARGLWAQIQTHGVLSGSNQIRSAVVDAMISLRMARRTERDSKMWADMLESASEGWVALEGELEAAITQGDLPPHIRERLRSSIRNLRGRRNSGEDRDSTP